MEAKHPQVEEATLPAEENRTIILAVLYRQCTKQSEASRAELKDPQDFELSIWRKPRDKGKAGELLPWEHSLGWWTWWVLVGSPRKWRPICLEVTYLRFWRRLGDYKLWHPGALVMLSKLGRQLAWATGREEGETVRHLPQRLSVLLVRDNMNMLLSRAPVMTVRFWISLQVLCAVMQNNFQLVSRLWTGWG